MGSTSSLIGVQPQTRHELINMFGAVPTDHQWRRISGRSMASLAAGLSELEGARGKIGGIRELLRPTAKTK